MLVDWSCLEGNSGCECGCELIVAKIDVAAFKGLLSLSHSHDE